MEAAGSDHYERFAKPRLARLLSLLKLDVSYAKGRGEHLYIREPAGEIPVIDMLGGYGSTILGHNHPEIKKAMEQALRDDAPVHAQASIRTQAALLGERLNQVIRAESPTGAPPKYLTHLINTGTEATEAAIKHAFLEWQSRREKALLLMKRERRRDPAFCPQIDRLVHLLQEARPYIVAIEDGFHGKTAGSLAVTSNPGYSGMYSRRAFDPEFLSRNAEPDEITEVLDRQQISITQTFAFPCVAAVLLEVVQGEGGVRCLDPGFVRRLAKECKDRNIPLIVDEIQTGMYRTGTLLASHGYGIDPDYVTLGKSLGGGLAKIAALLVREDRYQDEFGILHTSTFSEDDPSSRVAIRALNLLASDATLRNRARVFEDRIRDGMAAISHLYPGTIKEVRGRGFLMGVEFDTELGGRAPLLLDALRETGMITYLFASYLLHRHRLRVAPTLSHSNTIRLEPTAYVSDEAVRKTLEAFSDLARKIHEGLLLDLTSHLWDEPEKHRNSPIVSRFKTARTARPSGIREITFLSHFINPDHLKDFDPAMQAISDSDRAQFLERFSPLGESIVSAEQVIEGKNGEKVLLVLRGITASSKFFEQSIRHSDFNALWKVSRAAREAIEEGSHLIGLGQYTSIVSENGTLLHGLSVPMTTGNSLTAGLAFEALKKLLVDRGKPLSQVRVGVVGVAGNICNVYAQMLADEAGALTLIHREPYAQSPKFQKAVEAIAKNSLVTADRVRAECELATLADCDAVVLGTNTSGQILMPEHLKKGALVLDISVPSNVHPSVFSERPDVECFQGGYAKLPFGQVFDSPVVPCPKGDVFACMGETIVLGLLDYKRNFSYGPLNKAQVLKSLEMAHQVGIELGSLKKIASF